MQTFLAEDFLLHSDTAQRLYFDYAEAMPIFDYHCHLPINEIAENRQFANLTQIWLNGDHYKWRAMRANGIDEKFITGNAEDWDKFAAWAATVPYTLRNPLYHWTHLELKRYFGIEDTLLRPDTAREIYDTCTAQLQTDTFSTRALLNKMNVKVVCTTDDPVDSLEHHQRLQADEGFTVKVLPAFRADKGMAVDTPAVFNPWVDQLAAASGMTITNFENFMAALAQRHTYFHENGCRLSDHGIEHFVAQAFDMAVCDRIFSSARQGQKVTAKEAAIFRTAYLFELACMDAERGWTQQFHLGALRNTNSLAYQSLGPDSGYDSIGDWELATSMSRFLDMLARKGKLARTIIYVLNPRDNELVATMIGNFQDGSVPGKMQFGSGWWFNDQKDGMQRQIEALSNMGLLSRFVGMLTDSRSFLSYPRHEYFRRVLCNMLGTDVENGELPNDIELIGQMVQNICYHNAVAYFGITPPAN
jgi:glucuronate isomerase